MPLGWVLPNDGYGAGYGQTETLGGNIKNLKEFGDYARKNGVEIGLWTQSDLHPKEGISALLQRDIIKEVRDAGVRVLKTDVAWVGDGYSFGLNGVADVGEIMPKYGNDARPFIISLDGWAGTQRYAGIWSEIRLVVYGNIFVFIYQLISDPDYPDNLILHPIWMVFSEVRSLLLILEISSGKHSHQCS